MSAVTEVFRRINYNESGTKKIVIHGTAATGDTVDMHTDATDSKGLILKEIFEAYHVATTGTKVDASYNQTTGLVTLGTVAGTLLQVYIHIEGQ